MSKKRSFWNNPFGGLFDINGDGKEDLFEQGLAFEILEDMEKTENNSYKSSYDSDLFEPLNDYSWRFFVEDGSDYDIFPEDYETEEEYEEALEEAKYEWRDTVEDGFEYGIYPDDYETEEEYEEALKEAKDRRSVTDEDEFEFDMESDDYESEEDSETEDDYETRDGSGKKGIDPDAYPNKRRYNAAVTLSDDLIRYGEITYTENIKKRCKFILEQGDKIIAANYLTPDGDFLFSQAVKDNFDLQITLPDEDEESEFSLAGVLVKIARKDKKQAINVWRWCIEQFLPYEKYSPDSREILTNDMVQKITYLFPDDFIETVAAYLNECPDFREMLVKEGTDVPCKYSDITVTMIKMGYFDTAKALYADCLSKTNGGWKSINELTERLINTARMEGIDTMNFVDENLLPMVKAYPDGMIQDEVEYWEAEISKYKEAHYKEECSKEKRAEILADKTIYTYCGVKFPFSPRSYSFRVKDDDIKIGDKVIAEVGKDNKEAEGIVVSVGQYARTDVPYPVEKTKFIIRKA